jgi:hypothetical protein
MQAPYVAAELRIPDLLKEDPQPSDQLAAATATHVPARSAFLGIASYATGAPLNPVYCPDEFEVYPTQLAVQALFLLAYNALPVHHVARRPGLTVMHLETSLTPSAGGFTLRGAPLGFEAQD